MRTEFPRNFLVAAEYAHLMNAAGHGQEAVAAYRKVWLVVIAMPIPSCRIEVPAYGMGEAMRGQRDFQGAAEAYDLASSNGKDDELRAESHS